MVDRKRVTVRGRIFEQMAAYEIERDIAIRRRLWLIAWKMIGKEYAADVFSSLKPGTRRHRRLSAALSTL